MERFLAAIGTKTGFLLLLEEHPKLINLLSILFGSSDYLAGILINHPGILDSLIDRRSAKPVKNKETMADELSTMVSLEKDPENLLTVIRRFKNDETLRIGLYDLLGKLSLIQVQSQLTDLAEVVMDRTMALVSKMVLRGRPLKDAPFPLVVMGLGKLGGRELIYGSDLDLIFVMGEGTKPSLSLEDSVRLAQRFISFLSIHLEAGPGYEIDSRLRPSGSRGPLVVTVDSFTKYHLTSMLWERQALLKMRQSLGPASLGDRVKLEAKKAVFCHELPDDAARQIDDLRQRMSKERSRAQIRNNQS